MYEDENGYLTADPPAQLTGTDLAGMSSAAIVAAREAGQLDGILGLLEPDPHAAADLEQAPPPSTGSADQGSRSVGRPAGITRADLARMSPEQIISAGVHGLLDDVLTNP